MTSVVRFEEWQEPTGTTAATVDSSGNVSLSGDLSVSGSVTSTGNPQGLVFIKSVTVGSGVSSVTVSNAFDSRFDNYRVIISKVDVSNIGASFSMKISGSTGSTYNSAGVENSYAGTTLTAANFANSSAGARIGFTSNNNDLNIVVDIINPYLTEYTTFLSQYAGTTYTLDSRSLDQNAASSTGFTILPSSGTMTGGTIRVYGYGQ